MWSKFLQSCRVIDKPILECKCVFSRIRKMVKNKTKVCFINQMWDATRWVGSMVQRNMWMWSHNTPLHGLIVFFLFFPSTLGHGGCPEVCHMWVSSGQYGKAGAKAKLVSTPYWIALKAMIFVVVLCEKHVIHWCWCCDGHLIARTRIVTHTNGNNVCNPTCEHEQATFGRCNLNLHFQQPHVTSKAKMEECMPKCMFHSSW